VSRKAIAGNSAASSAGKRLSSAKPAVAIVGAGSLATFLAVALRRSGFTITEIIARDLPGSRRRARPLADTVGAQAVSVDSAELRADLLWFCVPDRDIRSAASDLADRLNCLALADHQVKLKVKLQGKVDAKVHPEGKARSRFAFHSSGALLSRELDPLHKIGIAVASVHPLMTFVRGAHPSAHPSLTNVPFALEGDAAAKRVAQRIVRQLGGKSFSLAPARKSAYHAWATMTSPLLLAFLVTLEDSARAAGLSRLEARRMSLPIIRQTLANYSHLGPAQSFSGPLIRGDVETVAKHLSAMKKQPVAREVYIALARAAVRGLPVKNRDKLKRLLKT
jgi:predicted short-subunit dehydrogenase-like oxidoreductase (DUF2520 family)